MLIRVHLFVFEVVGSAVLCVASHKRPGCFFQVILQVSVSGWDHARVLCFKIPGLVLFLGKPCILGKGGLIWKSVDITDFCNDAFRENRTNPLDGGQGIGNQFHLSGNGLIKGINLLLHCQYEAYGYGKHLVNGVIYRLWQAVGAPDGFLDGFRHRVRAREAVLPFLK